MAKESIVPENTKKWCVTRVLKHILLLVVCVGLFVGGGYGVIFGTKSFARPECRMTRMLLPLSLVGLGIVLYSFVVGFGPFQCPA